MVSAEESAAVVAMSEAVSVFTARWAESYGGAVNLTANEVHVGSVLIKQTHFSQSDQFEVGRMMLCAVMAPPTGVNETLVIGRINNIIDFCHIKKLGWMLNKTYVSFISADVEKVCISIEKLFIFSHSKLEKEKSFFSN